jgi:hypothetical protein
VERSKCDAANWCSVDTSLHHCKQLLVLQKKLSLPFYNYLLAFGFSILDQF